jgi:hypothetical protein
MNSNNGFLKPLCVSGVAIALDQFGMKETSLQRSLIFGGLVGAGSYVSVMVAPSITPSLPSLNAEMYNGKIVGERIVELTITASGVYAVNKYLLKNDIYKDEMLIRLGLILLSDIGGTYISEYIEGKPMLYLE